MTTAPFDLLVKQTNLKDPELISLKLAIEADYPADPMMQELRLIRTFHAIADGRVGIEEVLRDMAADQARRRVV